MKSLSYRYSIFILIVSFFFAVPVQAQKMTMGFLYPAGGQIGTTCVIEIGGLNFKKATEVMISGNGLKAEIIPIEEVSDRPTVKKGKKLDDQSSPQLADRIGVRITIAKNATPGLRDLRLKSPAGVSNKLVFEVGQYRNQKEERGSTQQKPTATGLLPATLCGQILPGEIDYFSFQATKGTKLVAAVKARTLVPYIADAVPGWFQAVISIKDQQGNEIAYNDDFRNSVDPVVITTIPETGTYVLAIHDAIFRGREDFNYRIDLGEIPFLEAIYPAVGKSGKKSEYELKGVNLKSQRVSYKPVDGYQVFNVPGATGAVSNGVPLLGLSKDQHLSLYPKHQKDLFVGTVVFDTLSVNRQLVTYTFTTEKNENVFLQVIARRLGSLMDAKIILRDEKGKVLQEVDDIEDASQGLITHHADPIMHFKANKAGVYTVEVLDVSGNYGKDFFYLIERKENVPKYEVYVSPANLTIPKGGTALMRVDIATKEKFVPEMDIEIKGLPKGSLVSNLKKQSGSKFWDLSVTIPSNTKEEKVALDVYTVEKLKGPEGEYVKQKAVAADNMMQAFYYTHFIPVAGFNADFAPESPFALRLDEQIERKLHEVIYFSQQDAVIPIKLHVVRRNGFKEPIEITLNRKGSKIYIDPVKIEPDETEKTILLRVDEKGLQKMKKFRFGFCFIGTVNGVIQRQGNRTFQNALYKEYSPIFVLELKD
ncbi:MAG: hypothetical protein Q7J05_01595 [Paludibacter sp.]|nr:hypothetical protein [Paludibacter sp.]